MRLDALAVVGLVLAGLAPASVGAAERNRRGTTRAAARAAPRAPEVIGFITYDTGVNVGFHPDVVGTTNRVVGNRFNSALGGPLLMTGRVYALTVFPANNGSQSVSIASAPTSMGTAMVLRFVAAPLMASQFNRVEFDPDVMVGPDFLGLFIGAYNTFQPAGLLGMSDMGTQGQGFHAVQGFYQGGLATMIQTVPNRNAMLRAWAQILVPWGRLELKVR